MSYYQARPIRDFIKRISLEEAEQYVPLKEDYTGLTVDRCPYYTMIDGGDEWSLITYFTGRKRSKYANRTVDYDSWVYVLSNSTMPGYVKIGFTDKTPEERASQLSKSTGVILPFKVEWAFHCYNAGALEKEIHHHLQGSRITGNREFFDISLDEAKKVITQFGQNYI